ncbi:MAG: sterol desaturase family protein [Betaproteobacteria bacterium]|nr:sterol desaturase family protein [Betaproteobacteria bacterium]
MSPILYAIPFFLACIAAELLISKMMGRQVYRFHDAVTSLNVGFMSETVRSMLKLASIVVYALVLDQVAVITWDVKHPAVWVVAFSCMTFSTTGRTPAGMKSTCCGLRMIHHSSEDFNLSTALRQSSTNQVFYWIFYLPMAIVGIPVSVFVVTALISMVYQFWSHTRLVPKLGWVDRMFVTPSNHRCHHGRNPYCIDKNYGGILIIWDRLFGTYTEELDHEPVVYGTLTPLQSWNPVWGNLKNYVVLWRDMCATPGWTHKLMLVFAPPGWTVVEQPALQGRAMDAPSFETPITPGQTCMARSPPSSSSPSPLNCCYQAPASSWPVRAGFAALIAANAGVFGLVV